VLSPAILVVAVNSGMPLFLKKIWYCKGTLFFPKVLVLLGNAYICPLKPEAVFNGRTH
jgi:hypothetical protein